MIERFIVLLVLSVVIATLGMWRDSVAVVIAAMLVAPLLIPIVALSLAELGVVSEKPGLLDGPGLPGPRAGGHRDRKSQEERKDRARSDPAWSVRR